MQFELCEEEGGGEGGANYARGLAPVSPFAFGWGAARVAGRSKYKPILPNTSKHRQMPANTSNTTANTSTHI